MTEKMSGKMYILSPNICAGGYNDGCTGNKAYQLMTQDNINENRSINRQFNTVLAITMLYLLLNRSALHSPFLCHNHTTPLDYQIEIWHPMRPDICSEYRPFTINPGEDRKD